MLPDASKKSSGSLMRYPRVLLGKRCVYSSPGGTNVSRPRTPRSPGLLECPPALQCSSTCHLSQQPVAGTHPASSIGLSATAFSHYSQQHLNVCICQGAGKERLSRDQSLLLFHRHKGAGAVLDRRVQAGTDRDAFMVNPLAAGSQQVGQHSACNFCAMLLLMGCAAVLLAQLRTSPSLRCPQMP